MKGGQFMATSLKPITLGYSPCPNDTFIFNGLINGPLEIPGHSIREQLHDVETLNQMAFDETLDVSKLSFFAWLMVKQHYRLLDCGGSLGFGCGPVVIAKRKLTHSDMAGCRIAIPGQWTTAHLLFRLWAPEARQRIFMPYHQIFDAIHQGKADCGVIIHESRFTFEQEGFCQVVDLGAFWEQQTQLPIPLGCIAAHKRIPKPVVHQLESQIRESISMAQADPAATLPYIRNHAQEMTRSVLDAHIQTFVNAFSLKLGSRGWAAVDALELKARQAGIIQ
jgi:1,4-dihydroxy-6-naphthoate synthase